MIFSFWGCRDGSGELVPEKEERAYRRGISLSKEGSNSEALMQFENVIAKRRMAPESHLQAGLLCLNFLKDPNSAIYHFNRYIGLNPGGEHVGHVKQLINTAKKEFMRSLPGDPFADEVERLDIYTRLQTVEAENLQLRQELATAQKELEAWQAHSGQLQQSVETLRNQTASYSGPVAPIVVQQRPTRPERTTPSGPRTYTVQAGDTLSKISREMYGDSARWTEIFQANRDLLPSQNSLRPGQILRIP